MESQKPKIALYTKRSLGEKLNTSFDFIKENWKPMLKFTTYLILPLCLVQALSLNGMMKRTLNMTINANMASETDFLISYLAYNGLLILICLLGFVLQTSLIYALMQTYSEREERLQGVTLKMLVPKLMRNIKKGFAVMLLGILLAIVFSILTGVLTAMFWPFIFLFLIAFFALGIPLILWMPACIFEDISAVKALKKSFRLGFATWGGIFMVTLIMGIVAGILQGVTMTPWYVATLVKMFFTMSEGGSEMTVSAGYSFMLYLLAIVQAFGAYLAYIFTLVGWAYQYGHASEKMDSVTIESDIDNFDKL